jgi:hypothetical protein
MEKKHHFENITLKPSEIFLDENNPRYPKQNNQKDAINTMLQDQGEKIINLAEDIYLYGLNPSSKMIVFLEDSTYIEGDGNRRLTAIKLLETPSLSDEFKNIRKRIDTILKGKGTIPEEIDCILFTSRAEAEHWIGINHIGEQEGRGQIKWNAEQINRFHGKTSIGLQALDFLLDKKLLSNEDKKRIQKSTFDRVLNSKAVKDIISIAKDGDKFIFNDIDNLAKVAMELRDKNVSSVYSTDEIQEFVKTSIQKPAVQKIYENQEEYPQIERTINVQDSASQKKAKVTRRIENKEPSLFGKTLVLLPGNVNNLYREINNIYNLYEKKGDVLNIGANIIPIIRMSLRLLCESASAESNQKIEDYIKCFFSKAKGKLNQSDKTFLHSHNVEEKTLVSLLHVGAHNYKLCENKHQVLAISIILGSILECSHGKQNA